jgi:hypothetical protein
LEVNLHILLNSMLEVHAVLPAPPGNNPQYPFGGLANLEVVAKKKNSPFRASNPVAQFLASLITELSWLLREQNINK